jgi:enolase-phosphatase E1
VSARGILLDIEGTTTPIAFVYDVLFPFARTHAAELLATADLNTLRAEYDADTARGLQPPPWSSGPVRYLHWLMDQDRKSAALKELQGRIWQQGYANGLLHGEVFPDVPPALERWKRQGVDIRIYSSGSVLAQRLLFSTTRSGDLTGFLSGYFDTTTGPKTEAASYRSIAGAFALPPRDLLFISDVTRELDAAAAAGVGTLLCIRPGNAPQPANDYEAIHDFDAVV